MRQSAESDPGDDYVPKGFHLGPGPIKGQFGLKLSPDDRQALIAFLKTL
jgi:hypothetical protein